MAGVVSENSNFMGFLYGEVTKWLSAPAKTEMKYVMEQSTALTLPKTPSCLKWYSAPESKDCYCMLDCRSAGVYEKGAEACYQANTQVSSC